MGRWLSMPDLQVVEDTPDDSGVFNARNDPDGTTTVLTDLNVNAEHSLEAASPRHRAVLFRSRHTLRFGSAG